MFQEPLPEWIKELKEEEIDLRIQMLKDELGKSLVILGHHYQRDEVIKFADYRGDSFKLSRTAATHPEAKTVIFCGVHFMAESADILCGGRTIVILPDMNAGCSMADMADIYQVRECWNALSSILEDNVTPITYINSSAALKDFCGRHDGVVCTSSNAFAAIKWGLSKSGKVLFFPDQHLGRNTAVKIGINLDDMVVWDPNKDNGGCSISSLRKAKIILWKGHCSVHQRFSPEQVRRVREEIPDIKVIVHPECRYEVVQLADYDGSTEKIIHTVTESASGTKWAVGTEINLVSRLAKENPDKFVISLDPIVCVCSTMYRIDQPHLLWALDSLKNRRIVNQIRVPEEIREGAKIALDRMLSLN